MHVHCENRRQLHTITCTLIDIISGALSARVLCTCRSIPFTCLVVLRAGQRISNFALHSARSHLTLPAEFEEPLPLPESLTWPLELPCSENR